MPPAPLTPGTRVGSYEIVTLLGVGGMAEVYRATDTKQIAEALEAAHGQGIIHRDLKPANFRARR